MAPDPVPQLPGLETPGISLLQSRYQGSSPFQDDDLSRILFYGRSNEGEVLLHKILVEDLVVLYARSGLGKTSLLNAGLARPLRERGFFPMICRVYVGDKVQPPDPLKSIYVSIEQNIARALGNKFLAEYHQGKMTTLWEYFKTLELWSPADLLLTPVLILDQFEEFFTFYDRAKRQALTEQLGDVVRGSIPKSLREHYSQPTEPKAVFPYSETPPKVKIIISLQEGYLGRLGELAQDLPSIRRNEFRLTPLDQENAQQAIVEPAQVAESRIIEVAQKDRPGLKVTQSFSYDANKLEEILEFLSNPEESPEGVEQNEIDPTQLQILCQYIEEKIKQRLSQEPGKELIVDHEILPGKNEMREAIQNFYDRALANIHPGSTRHKVFKLIENGLISRQNRRLSLARGDIQDRFEVRSTTLQELAKVHLLRAEYRLGDTYYELSHDTLIKPIQQSRKNRRRKKKKLLVAGLLLAIVFVIGTASWRVKKLTQEVDIFIQQEQSFKILEDARMSVAKGDVEGAKRQFQRGLIEWEKQYGSDSPEALEILNNLFYIAIAQQRFDEAEFYRQQILNKLAKTPNPDNLNFAANLTKLALLYQEKGKYELALPLLQQVNNIVSNALGPDNYHTATSLTNLGLLYQAMGEYDKALPLLKQALIITKQTRDPNNPDIATSLTNLGLLYQAMGNYDQALPLLEQALSIREKVLDDYDPVLEKSRSDLKFVRELLVKKSQGRFLAQQAQFTKFLEDYYSLIKSKEFDKAKQYWGRGVKVRWDEIKKNAEDTEYYKVNRVELYQIDNDRARAKIELAHKDKYMDKKVLSGIVSFKKEGENWKMTKIDYPPKNEEL